MPKFRVLVGQHQQYHKGKPKTYKVGDIVDYPGDLIKMFPNKFGPADSIVVNPTPVEDPTSDEETEQEGSEGEVPGNPSSTSSKTPPVPVPYDPNVKVASTLGRDVTSRFPQAIKTGVRVFRQGVNYQITTNEEPNTSISGVLKDKEVDKWCEEN